MSQSVRFYAGIDAGDFRGDTNASLQAAVDACAAAGGGTVEIGAGVYTMRDSLHLRDHVRIAGQGKDTILRKSPSVFSPLIGYMGYGHYDVSVAHPRLFPVGTGVHITDKNAFGFYDTVATVTWRDDERLGLSRMLNHDYSAADGGTIASVHPVISGYDVHDAVVENLTVDGAKECNQHLHGCRGGGVFLLRTERVVIRSVEVHSYNGDGISAQQCIDLTIEHCMIRSNTGAGLHPGSGSVGMVIRKTSVSGNDGDGVFYCLRVAYSLLEDCIIAHNGGHGISLGGRDTDHLIRNNVIHGNADCGVYFRPGDEYMGAHRNTLLGNRIGPNGLRDRKPEIFVEGPALQLALLNNVLILHPPHSGPAIVLGEQCPDSTISGTLYDQLRGDLSFAHSPANMGITAPTPLAPPTNWSGRPADATRHLRPAPLPPFVRP